MSFQPPQPPPPQSTHPTITFTTIGNLSDVLKGLPLATPIEYSNNNVHSQQLQQQIPPLIANQQQYELTNELINNTTDHLLIKQIENALSQVDTSNILMKNDNNNNNQKQTFAELPQLLQKTLQFNPNLFNGEFSHQLLYYQQQQQQQQQYILQSNANHVQMLPTQQQHQSPSYINNEQSAINNQQQQPSYYQNNSNSVQTNYYQQQQQQQQQPQNSQNYQSPITNNTSKQLTTPQKQIQAAPCELTSASSSTTTQQQPQITNKIPTNQPTSANNEQIYGTNNNSNNKTEYAIVQNANDTNKLTLKIAKKPTNNDLNDHHHQQEYGSIEQLINNQQVKKEADIRPNKFYSKPQQPPPQPVQQQQQPIKFESNIQKNSIQKPKPQLQQQQQQQTSQQQSISSFNDDKLKFSRQNKIERNLSTKSSKDTLSTWQANLTSQLELPSDFTPELIAQLASEGYDVISATRKARSRAPQIITAPRLNNDEDDDDDEENDEYKITKKLQNNKKSGVNKPHSSTTTNDSLINDLKLKRQERLSIASNDYLQEPTEHPSYKRFTSLVDDLLESFDNDFQQNRIKFNSSDENNDDTSIDDYLISRQLCSELAQEAFKLNSYSIMTLIKRDTLIKLQTIIYFNIKDGARTCYDNEQQLVQQQHHHAGSADDQERLLREIIFEKLMRAADASILSLLIMTSPNIGKEIIIEDLLEQISLFTKTHLANTIFPQYDSVYRNSTTNSNGNTTITGPTNNELTKSAVKRTKLHFSSTSTGGGTSSSGGGAASLQKYTKSMQYFYNRLREILNLLGELVKLIDNLTDTIVITLSTMCIQCFFVDNINDIQLEALKILTNIFSKYEKHRQLIFDDILSSLAKLHVNKRNLRTYKCFNSDSIQMVSALSLQLIQSEVCCISKNAVSSTTSVAHTNDDENNQQNNNGETDNLISFEEKESYVINSYENSSQTAKKFLSVFFHKCKIKQADFDFRPIFENFIQDLLITVNKPEWPASELILNMLGIILVSQINNEQNDVASRVNSLEYLGQIVSQLRKDSLESQKNPEKLKYVLKKVKTLIEANDLMQQQQLQNLDFDELIKEHEFLYQVQKCLISYLDTLEANDSSLQYAKRFFIAQWLKELNPSGKIDQMEHGEERIEKYQSIEKQRKKLYELLEKENLSQQNILDYNDTFILCKYLCSLKKSLDKNFDYYLVNILNLLGGSNESSTPTQVRSKAIKCLSLIIEADAQVLLKQKVFTCVQANFLHQTISVREAAVDLIGRFITIKPELTAHYYNLLSDRILDVGVSVRKRVIKIFRDICINQPTFEHLSEICVKILRRINDEDGIKKLVIDTFYHLWFTPLQTHEQLLQRVLNIVDVISELNTTTNVAQTSEYVEQLFNSLIQIQQQQQQSQLQQQSLLMSNSNESSSTSMMSSKEKEESETQAQRCKDVLKSCKQIVDCLIEHVLSTEANTSTPQAYKRLVASFSTLYLLSKIKPDNFINHAETLLPYLNIKSTNQNDNQIINSASRILECVVPLLHCPSNSFLVSLEESLCKLLFQGGMMIVSSCINCLGAVVNKLTKNYKLAADCFSKFYKNGIIIKNNLLANKPLENTTKAYIFRMLFTLGLLSKQFDLETDELKKFEICSKEDLFKLFMFFIKQPDIDIKHKALIGLGSFLTRYNDYMLINDIKNLYLNYLNSSNVPIILKSQVFTNLTEYLNEEDKRNFAQSSQLTKTHCKDDLKEMLDVQSGMASTIIQSYFKSILESYLTSNVMLRINVMNCLHQILTQGLVYPIECVPYLIAMTTDLEKKIQVKSLQHLTTLHKAHPGFIQSKSIAGLNMSYRLHKIIKIAEYQEKNKTIEGSQQMTNKIIVRGIIENSNEILSHNHHLYSLLRVARSFRRAFIQQLLKMFDDSSMYHASLGHLLYICDNLAYFPYQLIDEPLYLMHQIDIIISVTGVNILQSFKENLIKRNSRNSEQVNENILNQHKPQTNENDAINKCFDDMNCIVPTDEEQEKKDADAIIETQTKPSTSKIDDDEEETLENILENLPKDLKPLKDCMINAQGCCLLLILKQFLKEIYSITDSRIQNYSPTDLAKLNDKPIGSRKTNYKFNPKQIIEYLTQSLINKSENEDDNHDEKVKLVQEYLEFKELMLSIDHEEENSDEKKQVSTNQPNLVNTKSNTTLNTNANACSLRLKLLEGIEKLPNAGNKSNSGQSNSNNNNNSNEYTPVTPRNSTKSVSRIKKQAGGNSSTKKSTIKKRKRKLIDSSDVESDKNSDFDDDY